MEATKGRQSMNDESDVVQLSFKDLEMFRARSEF